MARRALTCIALMLWAATACAHEMRPAYASLTENEHGQVEVEFRQPIIGGRFFDLQLQLGCPDRTPPVSRGDAATIIQTWTADCSETGLGQVSVAGLSNTVIDVLLTWTPRDGGQRTFVITPESPVANLAPAEYPGLPAYMTLGIQHLLEGLDHVLFVIGLMMLVRGPWRLVKTITSFTVAHSITLALSSLDLIRLSQGPVEAAIALSLVFIAWENVAPNRDETLTARRPWQVAFVFGLLHGLGFAGVLREIGMPEDQLVGALFLFNVGIEIGQLIIVAAMLALALLWRRLTDTLAVPAPGLLAARLVPVYGIGVISSYWVIERTVALLA